jgi:hypothetical protein
MDKKSIEENAVTGWRFRAWRVLLVMESGFAFRDAPWYPALLLLHND